MNLLYIANARIPTEKAHGLHIAKMCEAFANQGASVTLIIPKRKNAIKQDVFSYYGIEKNFEVQYLPVIDLVSKGFVGFWLTQIFFSWQLLKLRFDKNEFVVITRDELSGWLMRQRGFRVFYDMHGFPESWLSFWKVAMKKMSGIICTNEWKMNQLQERFHIPTEHMVLARNGFDPNEFNTDVSKHDAREMLGLPEEGPIVMYAGHLYDWKGVDVLARVATSLENVTTVFVGGTERDVKSFTQRHGVRNNVLVLGHQPHNQIPMYLKAADVLVLPNSKKSQNPRAIPYSIYDTSPIKLFEYMASGCPIVASDLPSIREILDESMAVFFEPDDPEDLAQKINIVLQNESEASVRANNALEVAQEYTWGKRSHTILEFIKNSL